MIQWFKDGKALPKRYVWEIVLGAYEQFMKEESLVNVDIPDNVTIDIIGDVHGYYFHRQLVNFFIDLFQRPILRFTPSILFDWGAERKTLFVDEW